MTFVSAYEAIVPSVVSREQLDKVLSMHKTRPSRSVEEQIWQAIAKSVRKQTQKTNELELVNDLKGTSKNKLIRLLQDGCKAKEKEELWKMMPAVSKVPVPQKKRRLTQNWQNSSEYRRIEELEKSFESNSSVGEVLNRSLNTWIGDMEVTSSESNYGDMEETSSESEEQERRRLQEENAKLKEANRLLHQVNKKLLEENDCLRQNQIHSEKLAGLFQKEKGKFSNRTALMTVKLLVHGESAPAITRMYQTIHDVAPQFFGENSSVPKKTYIKDMRYVFAPLNCAQVQQFAEKSTQLFIAMDCTTSLDNQEVLTLGAFNQKLEYAVFGFKAIPSGKAADIREGARSIFRNIDSSFLANISGKVKGTITDKCPAQVAANGLLLNDLSALTEQERTQAYCHMHMIGHLEKHVFQELDTECKNFLQSGKLHFGARKKSGEHMNNFKPELKLLDPEASLQTDMGVRFAVHSGNAQTLILKEHVFLEVLKGKGNNKKASTMIKSYQKNRDAIICQSGFLSLMWTVVIGRYWSKINDVPMTQKQAKEELYKLLEEVQRLMEDPIQRIDVLASKTLENDAKEGKKNKIKEETKAAWNRLTTAKKEDVKIRFTAGLKGVEQKIRRDFSSIIQRGEDWNDVLIPLTTQHTESSFGFLKSTEASFIDLGLRNCLEVTMAKQNKLDKWLSNQPDSLSLVQEAKKKTREAKRKSKEEEMDYDNQRLTRLRKVQATEDVKSRVRALLEENDSFVSTKFSELNSKRKKLVEHFEGDEEKKTAKKEYVFALAEHLGEHTGKCFLTAKSARQHIESILP